MARPGFVLEVDERTPPLVVPDGDNFRLERFPLGTKVVYPADSCQALPDLAEAVNAAVDAPLASEPLDELLRAGSTVTIVVDDNTVPVPPMRRPDVRATVIEQVLEPGRPGRRRRRRADRRHRAQPAADGVGAAEAVRRAGLPLVLRRRAAAQPRRGERRPAASTVDGSSINSRVADSDLVVYVHVVADPRHSVGSELAGAVGSVATVAAATERGRRRPASAAAARARVPDRRGARQRRVPGRTRLPRQAGVGMEHQGAGRLAGDPTRPRRWHRTGPVAGSSTVARPRSRPPASSPALRPRSARPVRS